jgi:hypothetical protein
MSTAARVRSSAAAARLGALLVALGSGGCSFAIMRPPPARDSWPNPVTAHSSQERCSNIASPPIADTVVGAGFGTLGFVERNSGSPKVAFVLGASAVPYLVSAIYGYVALARCRSYVSRFDPANLVDGQK